MAVGGGDDQRQHRAGRKVHVIDRLVRLEQDLPARQRQLFQMRGKATQIVMAESRKKAVVL